MKKTVVCFLVFLGVVCGGLADDALIAVVDMGHLIAAHPQTEVNRSVLREEIAEFEAEQDKLVKDLDAMRMDVEMTARDASNTALSEEARKESLESAREKSVKFQKSEMEARKKVMKREKEISDQRLRMRRRVIGSLAEIISEYAGKKKFLLVLDAAGISANGSETVVYSKEQADITADILEIIKKAK